MISHEIFLLCLLSVLGGVVVVSILLTQQEKMRFHPLSEKELKKFLNKHQSELFRIVDCAYIHHIARCRLCLEYFVCVRLKTVTGTEEYSEPKIIYAELVHEYNLLKMSGKSVYFRVSNGRIKAVEYNPEKAEMHSI